MLSNNEQSSGIMMNGDNSQHTLKKNGSIAFSHGVSFSETGERSGRWSWSGFQAGTSLEIRASHLLRAVCALMVLIFIMTVVFHTRIRALEAQKDRLSSDLSEVKMHLEVVIQRLDTIAALAIPPKSFEKQINFNSEETQDLHNSESQVKRNHGHEHTKTLVKRATHVITTQELKYSSPSHSLNALGNGSAPFDPTMDDSTTVGPTGGAISPKSMKGNTMERHSKGFRRRKWTWFRKQLKDLKTSHRLEISDLKRNFSQFQQQMHSANLSCCKVDNASLQHSLYNVPSGIAYYGQTQIRAAYLQIDGSSVNIKRPKQVIGPWYLPSTGADVGFQDMWYNNLKLDSNGTSVVFKENGLFLIYAQVYYQQHILDGKPLPMGYRIYLKKSLNANNSHSYLRPVAIAECVPSYPTTVYQTCFTQVAWYVNAKDEIYLEHFTDSKPIIDALRPGQTFLGIVRLS